jgi:uncharacterized membrane protein YhaH (DUF805 family)/thiol-disulfide isomerase/thioredoxin
MSLMSKLFSFNGRIGRASYWLCLLVIMALFFVLMKLLIGDDLAKFVASSNPSPEAISAFWGQHRGKLVVLALLLAWPSLAVEVKRLHDHNRSGWWSIAINFVFALGAPGSPIYLGEALGELISFVSWLGFLIYFGFMKGTEGPNDYGNDPRGNTASVVESARPGFKTCPACQRQAAIELEECPWCEIKFSEYKAVASAKPAAARTFTRPILALIAALVVFVGYQNLKQPAGEVATNRSSGRTPFGESLGSLMPGHAKAAPDFHLLTMEGIEYSKQSLSGRPLLILFWAPWCPYCQAELPRLARFYQQGKPSHLNVLAIGVRDTRDHVAGYINDHLSTFVFPTVYDVGNQVAGAMGITGVPTYVLLDARGNIVVVDPGGGNNVEEATFQQALESVKN